MAGILRHKILALIGDILIVNLSFCLALWLLCRSGLYFSIAQFPFRLLPGYLMGSLILILLFQMHHLYKYQFIEDSHNQVVALAKSMLKGYVALLAIILLLGHQLVIHGMTLLLSFAILSPLMILYRTIFIPKIYRYLKRCGRVKKHVIMVGAGERGRRLAQAINAKEDSYFRVIGFVDDKSRFRGKEFHGIPVLGTISAIRAVAENHRPDALIIAINSVSHDRLMEIINDCKRVGCPIHVISDLYRVIPDRLEVEHFDGIPTFLLKKQHSRVLFNLFKKCFDLAFSLVALAVFSPALLTVALAIKLDSKGPVLYRRKVIGSNGKEFTFYKFRTMLHNSDDEIHQSFMERLIHGEDNDSEFKIRDDPRVTKLGQTLRKHSIDEFPQFLNVLKGDMSIVGPRPSNVEEYQHYKPWHNERLSVKPGITGLWQVLARSDVSYDDMVVLDIYYRENQSPWLDAEIMVRTIPAMLLGNGAF